MGKMLKLEEDLKELRKLNEKSVEKVEAVEQKDSDSVTLNIPWTCMEQVTDAMQNPAKKMACSRLLNSGIITKKEPHVITQAFKLFFDESIVNKLCIKIPAG